MERGEARNVRIESETVRSLELGGVFMNILFLKLIWLGKGAVSFIFPQLEFVFRSRLNASFED